MNPLYTFPTHLLYIHFIIIPNLRLHIRIPFGFLRPNFLQIFISQLRFDHSNIIWWTVSQPDVPGKFWNVVLEKDGEDKLDGPRKKWSSVTQSNGGKEHSSHNKTKGDQLDWAYLCRKCLLNHITEGKISGTRRRGRRHKQLLDGLKEERRYRKLKEEVQDHIIWKTQFARGHGPVARQTTTWLDLTSTYN
jgi:hypothetical protein